MHELKILQPELIIGDYSHADFYDAFKHIAPTVILSYDHDWRIPHLKIAELVGRETEARHTIADSEVKAAAVKKIINQMSSPQRVTVMQVMNDHVMLQGTINHPLNTLLYTELGLAPGKHVPLNKMRLELFTPDIPPLETEKLWIRLYSDQPEIAQVLRNMQNLPYWGSIDAVRNNQVRYISNWFIMSWTPQGRSQIMDEVLGYLRVDG
ncbi:iron-enterobactin transporter periplasmic binding protein [compost metagenome]